jgi:hypothetical protein
LRNELGRLSIDGSEDLGFEPAQGRGFFFLLAASVAKRIFPYCRSEALKFRKRFVKAALGGSAVAECKRERCGIDAIVRFKRSEFELEGAVETPLAERHLLEQQFFRLGCGFPFLIEERANGVELFEIRANQLCGAETMPDRVPRRSSFAVFGAGTGRTAGRGCLRRQVERMRHSGCVLRVLAGGVLQGTALATVHG